MKKTTTPSNKPAASNPAAHEIDSQINDLQDWRGAALARIRQLIHRAEPNVIEEVKWRKPSNNMRGVPVWSHAGILCTGETYKSAVKLTFPHGAALPDPTGLFNASLDGNTRRAIDLHENDKLPEKPFLALLCAAAAHNTSKASTIGSTHSRKRVK